MNFKDKYLFIKVCVPPYQLEFCEFFKNKLINYNKYLVQEKFKASRDLVGNIYDFLNEININISDINRIYCINGPGSYTASRLSVVITKNLALIFKNINIYTVNILYLYLNLNFSNFDNINKEIKKISIIPAYGDKYYFAEKENVIKYHILSLSDIKKKIKDKNIINGFFCYGKDIESFITSKRFLVEVPIKKWIKYSTKIEDIYRYDAFYFDKDEVNVN